MFSHVNEALKVNKYISEYGLSLLLLWRALLLEQDLTDEVSA